MNFFRKLFTIFFVFLITPCYSWSRDNIVKSIGFNDKQNLEILISEKPQYKAYVLHNPERMVIDIFDTDIDSRFEAQDMPSFVSDIRRSKSQGNLRIVLDLKAKVIINSSSFQKLKRDKEGKILVKISVGDVINVSDEENKNLAQPYKNLSDDDVNKNIPVKNSLPKAEIKKEENSNLDGPKNSLEEIIIDVAKDESVNIAAQKNANSVKYVIKKSAEPANQVEAKKSAPRKIPVIAIDAGHGGKDPGTIGDYARTKEKFITLSYARELAKKLSDTKNYKVHLIRNSDEFVPLKRRVEKARQLKADLFISLHANAAADSKVSGFSIYTLSEKSSDKQAELLAQKENRADIIAGVNFGDTSGDILKTLIDLSQRSSMNSSANFASIAIKSVKNSGVEILHNTHRFAGFMVLTAPDMTSVLIELGYLSNKSEEAKLNSVIHKRNITKGLVDAIDEYFRINHN